MKKNEPSRARLLSMTGRVGRNSKKWFLAILIGISIGFAIPRGAESAEPIDGVTARTIDTLIAKWQEKRGIVAGGEIDDQTFVRRIYLDAIGRIPTAREIREFLQKDSEDKRSELIDDLLASEGYVNHMFHFLADILRINYVEGGGPRVVIPYIQYVKQSLRENKPYDVFVRELITAEGLSDENGAVGYYYRDRNMPLDNMANTARIFLGTRLECAQCHDHPFDTWTQMDFYQMAAFSYGMVPANLGGGSQIDKLGKKLKASRDFDADQKQTMLVALRFIRLPIRGKVIVHHHFGRVLRLPHDYQYDDAEPEQTVTEAVIFGDDPQISSPGEKIVKYAEWMTSPGNPRFTKVIVNRLWKKAFGIGLVEPVDEYTDMTTASHPELFAFLESEMTRLNYDLRAFLKMLYRTKIYQGESVGEEILSPFQYQFTGPLLRRMTAEQIWDSLVTLINVRPELGDWVGELETALGDASSQMLSDAVTTKSDEQLLRDAQTVTQLREDIRERAVAVQEMLAEARQNRDQERIRELVGEAAEIRKMLRDQVYTRVFFPALQKMKTETVSYTLPGSMGSFDFSIGPESFTDNGRLHNGAVDELKKAAREIYRKQMVAEGLPVGDERIERDYIRFRETMTRFYIRAANLGSPAPPGHFLRQFGQSDRETIENAEQAASVPQALTLLNGPVFETILKPYSVLSREMAATSTSEEKITSIYLSILGRTPTGEEIEHILPHFEDRGETLYGDLIVALLNTREFMYSR